MSRRKPGHDCPCEQNMSGAQIQATGTPLDEWRWPKIPLNFPSPNCLSLLFISLERRSDSQLHFHQVSEWKDQCLGRRHREARVVTADMSRSESKQSGGGELCALCRIRIRASSTITQDRKKTCLRNFLTPGPRWWKELRCFKFKSRIKTLQTQWACALKITLI